MMSREDYEAACARVATLRTYAKIFESPRRHFAGGTLLPPNEINKAAAEALYFHAAEIEERVLARYGARPDIVNA